MRVLVVAEGAHELGGALQTLIRRLTASPIEFEEKRISSKELHIHRGKGRGFFKRALRWMIKAQEDNYDALILVVDEDHDSERTRDITDAQNHALGIKRRALGVAIHTFDAWMVADEKAVSQALQTSVQRQSAPETIADAKSVFKALREMSEQRANLPELYAEIATQLDLQLVEERCPRGFGAFATRIRAIGSLGSAPCDL